MEWDREAQEAIERVPFFVRRMVKKRIEGLAAERRQARVTVEDVHDARQRFADGQPMSEGQTQTTATAENAGRPAIDESISAVPVDDGRPSTLANITADQLEQIEAAVDHIEGYENRFFSVRVCGGAAGCPLTKVDVRRIGDNLAAQIGRSGLAEDMRAKIQGPIFAHHRFKVGIAGCPNNCSEPQIKDLSLVAQTKPGLSTEPCIECGLCVEACREKSITIEKGVPLVDYQMCVGCGDCIEACPTGTLYAEKDGLTIYVGGRLGRHAQLATPLTECASEEQAYQALDACLSLQEEEGAKGERLGNVLNRVGLDGLRRRLGR